MEVGKAVHEGSQFGMKTLHTVRYWLFAALFALVLVGLMIRSYPLLIALVIMAIILGVIGDKLESAPTEKFKQYNAQHHRLHH